MKKIYLLFLLIAAVAVKAQNVNFGTSLQFKNRIVNSTNGGGIAYNSAGQHMKVDVNSDGQIQVTEALNVWEIRVEDATSMQGMTGLNSFTNLRVLEIDQTGVTTLNIQALVNLETLIIYDNFTSIVLNGLPNLKNINIQQTSITTLNLTGLPSLENVIASYNAITGSINVSQSPNLINLDLGYNNLSSVNVAGLTNVKKINLINNHINTINLTGLENSLEELNLNSTSLDALNVNGFINLKKLACGGNQLTQLDVQSLQNLEYLYCHNNQLTNLNVQGLGNIIEITCANNQLSSINLQGLTTLYNFSVINNNLTTLDAQGLPELKFLYCQNNDLTSINVTGNINLEYFNCSFNQLTELDVSTLESLTYLNCNDNLLTEISTVGTNGVNLRCWNNQLVSINLKDGGSGLPEFYNNPNLTYICADDFEIDMVHYELFELGIDEIVELNSYCSDFANPFPVDIIQGTVTFFTSPGVGPGTVVNNLVVHNDGSGNTMTTNAQGQYSFISDQFSGFIYPALENPQLFLNPQTSYSFVSSSSETITININFWPYHLLSKADVETLLIPLNDARPGEDALYKLVLRNKGNINASGVVNIAFDDTISDFVVSTPGVAAQEGLLAWNYTDIPPFGSQEFLFTMHINETNNMSQVTVGNILTYSIVANLTEGEDYTPVDNNFILKQTVYDTDSSNNKICLEGAYIAPDQVDEYVHYVIRFENNGTTNAQTVIINDVLDYDKFDINSLIVLSGSHSYVMKKMDNRYDFIFENINLPFDEANNDGYIAFKVKPLSTLQNGNTLSNYARIYFDYGSAIVTNTATLQAAIPQTSILITTQGDVPSSIINDNGTLQLLASIQPAQANQNVTWSILSGSEFATISETGLVTAIHNGSVTVQATSVQNPAIVSTLEILISGQIIPAESVTVSVADNAPAVITTDDGTLQLVAAILPTEADQNVTWSILSGGEFATISETGLVTATHNGSVAVQAASVQNPAIVSTLEILISGQIIPAESVTVLVADNAPAVITTDDGTLQLVAAVLPAQANQNVTWSILSGSEFATISETGLVTATHNGTITVQAASVQNPAIGGTREIVINGQIIPVESVTVLVADNAPAVITTDNGTLQLVATVLPAEADQNVIWNIISGSEFATISETGLVTATHNGTITVQATSEQNPAIVNTLEILISGQIIPAESVTVSVAENAPTTITTDDGTLQLVATVLPAEADQNVIWSIVSGSEFATISETGLVTATHNGTVTVQAASVNFPSVSGTIQIEITEQEVPVESITVTVSDGEPLSITVPGGTLQLIAVVLPAEANQNVIWTIISGSEFATITESGLITAIANGTIVVQAQSVVTSPDGRNSNIIFDTIEIIITGQSLNVVDNELDNFIIYPNPASDIINIQAPDSIIQLVKIYNSLGQLVLTHNNDSRHTGINISTLSSGMYILKVKSKDGTSTYSFIKK